MHDFAADFIARHKDQPFFLYYPMSHIHGPIIPTPDSQPGADKDRLYADNIEYMDKLVGKLVAELDLLKLREPGDKKKDRNRPKKNNRMNGPLDPPAENTDTISWK